MWAKYSGLMSYSVTVPGLAAGASKDSSFTIRSMSAMPDGRKLYGVGGDIDDLGILFTYDDCCGLRWLGHIYHDSSDYTGSANCTVLSVCTISPDGKKLAIGSGDRLGTVVIYTL